MKSGQLYLPEGRRYGSEENKRAAADYASLLLAMEQKTILEGIVTRCDRNLTLTVAFGRFTGYIPREEIVYSVTGEQAKDIAAITRVGKAVCFEILSAEGSEDSPCLLLSRRAAQKECMENYLLQAKPGDILPARVTHMEQFGAFVDIGCGVVSLLPVDTVSVSRISHPRDRFAIGQDIRAVVRAVEPETGRLYLTHRELLGTWEENASRFSVGQTVTGTVRSVEEYGIFLELAPNLAGLAERREGVKAGMSASVYIKNILPDRMKLKLVLIDLSPVSPPQRQLEYFIPESQKHLSRWQYSPAGAGRVIETVFEEDGSENEEACGETRFS